MTLVSSDEEGNDLTPAFLRRRGLREAVGAEVLLRHGGACGEELARRALSDLVEAFLHDRQAKSDLFGRAHRVGALLSEVAGCRWTSGDEAYTLRCPVYALHQRWATSIAMTVTTRCSVCGAGDLECDHLPGESYDDKVCSSVVESIGSIGHVALTANPDFTHTWHQEQRVSTEELVRDGVIGEAGESAFCSHCRSCSGIHGPSRGDLDPEGRWRELVTTAHARHIAQSSDGPS
jgi:hypothetical protein